MRRDKRRRIEFLRKKQPNLPQDAPPDYGLSLYRGEGGSTREAGAEIEETDDEANGAQGEITLQSFKETIISMNEKLEKLANRDNDPKEEEQEREQLQKNDEDNEDHLLELTGWLGTRMKCFQREVEATDEKIAKTKQLSSVSPRSPKRKRRKKR